MGDSDIATPTIYGVSKLKGREDYADWAFSMMNFFKRHGLWKAA